MLYVAMQVVEKPSYLIWFLFRIFVPKNWMLISIPWQLLGHIHYHKETGEAERFTHLTRVLPKHRLNRYWPPPSIAWKMSPSIACTSCRLIWKIFSCELLRTTISKYCASEWKLGNIAKTKGTNRGFRESSNNFFYGVRSKLSFSVYRWFKTFSHLTTSE